MRAEDESPRAAARRIVNEALAERARAGDAWAAEELTRRTRVRWEAVEQRMAEAGEILGGALRRAADQAAAFMGGLERAMRAVGLDEDDDGLMHLPRAEEERDGRG